MKIEEAISRTAERFLEELEKDKFVEIISHFDTDGITAAAIMTKTLKRLDKKFHVSIVKQLDQEYLDELINKEIEILLFLDLGSSYIESLKEFKIPIFILDHHEIPENSSFSNINIINCHNFDEEISGAGIAYLFSKSINEKNKDLASLAVLGMVGDMIDQDINKLNNIILKDAEIIVRKGPLIFSSTRSLHKALEFSHSIFIPGVTGSPKGVSEILRETEIKIKNNDRYRTLLDLTNEETSRLVTEIILRRNDKNPESILGNIYLLKFFNHQEDARELSTLINACGRLGHAGVAIALCLGCHKAKESAEEIYNTYKHKIINALKWVSANKKIEGQGYIIINAKKEIDDSIIGTVTSIIASSSMHPKGTLIVGMSKRSDEKIKVSMRVAGKSSDVNVYEILSRICPSLNIEYGGHPNAGGCIFPEEKENEFIEALEKELSIKGISINI